MNYIYDIVLNFQDNYYNFFEWDRKDKIKNISKVPIYRVTDHDLLILKNNQVKVGDSFLTQVKEDNKKHKKNICLVSNTQISIGLLIDEDGTILKRSSLLFEEEEEANNFSDTLPITEISYLENKEIIPQEKLRIEIERKDHLINYINNNTDPMILKYLYYEYYQEECEDYNKIKKSLLTELEKDWNMKQNNLYQIIKLLNKNNLLMK